MSLVDSIPMSWKREISIYNNKIDSQNMNPNMQKKKG